MDTVYGNSILSDDGTKFLTTEDGNYYIRVLK